MRIFSIAIILVLFYMAGGESLGNGIQSGTAALVLLTGAAVAFVWHRRQVTA